MRTATLLGAVVLVGLAAGCGADGPPVAAGPATTCGEALARAGERLQAVGEYAIAGQPLAALPMALAVASDAADADAAQEALDRVEEVTEELDRIGERLDAIGPVDVEALCQPTSPDAQCTAGFAAVAMALESGDEAVGSGRALASATVELGRAVDTGDLGAARAALGRAESLQRDVAEHGREMLGWQSTIAAATGQCGVT